MNQTTIEPAAAAPAAPLRYPLCECGKSSSYTSRSPDGEMVGVCTECAAAQRAE